MARRLALLGLLLALALGSGGIACAVDVGRTMLTVPPIDSMVPPGASRVGLFPLRDTRPERQREGESPWFWPLILINWRIGDWYTSDEVLGGDVLATVNQGFTRSLEGGRFGRAQLLPAGPDGGAAPSVNDRCRQGDLDFVAAGSLSDLYGYSRQRSYFAVLPIPFVWLIGFAHDQSDPLGVANVTLQVFDCRSQRLVYRRQLLSQRRYPGETLTDAANRAFHDLLEQLTNETR